MGPTSGIVAGLSTAAIHVGSVEGCVYSWCGLDEAPTRPHQSDDRPGSCTLGSQHGSPTPAFRNPPRRITRIGYVVNQSVCQSVAKASLRGGEGGGVQRTTMVSAVACIAQALVARINLGLALSLGPC